MHVEMFRQFLDGLKNEDDAKLINLVQKGFDELFGESDKDEHLKDLIEKMNEDIQALYTAVIQYNNHAALIEGAEWMGYVEDLKQHIQDDSGQATELADKVAYYGGVPTLKIGVPKTAKESRTMIEQDEAIQRKNVETYAKRVKFCESIGETAMMHFYLKLSEHEEEHHNTTLSFLGMKK